MSGGDRPLPLHAQKAVVGRFLVFQVLSRYEAELAGAGYGVLLTAMAEQLRAHTALEIEFPSDRPLDSYLIHLGVKIRQSVTFPSPDAERACMPLLEEIDRVLATGGQAREDLLLTAFADALQAAVNAYEQHGMHVPPDLVKRTTVTFEYQLGPVQTVLPIQLSAVTTLTDPGQLAAGVGVLVSPAGLDKVTAFSLPYVLLHECVCHVLQGPWQPGRIQNDPGDRFAEGWMDVAAYLVHEMTEWPRHTAKPDQLIRDEQSAAATKVHHARQERQPHDRAWAARAMGAMAARGTLKLLGSLPESRNDAENAFLCLTLHLNASSYPNGDRALFVLKVYQALQRRADHQLTPLLRAYLSTGALDPLVTGVLPLFD